VAYFLRAQLTLLTFALQNGGIRYEKAYWLPKFRNWLPAGYQNLEIGCQLATKIISQMEPC
jgi:hypothetical protein